MFISPRHGDMASSTITSCSAVLDILNCVFGEMNDNTAHKKLKRESAKGLTLQSEDQAAG